MEQNRQLSGFWFYAFLVATVTALLLVINQTFQLDLFGLGVVISQHQFLYSTLGLYLSFSFIIYPGTSGQNGRRIPWYDILFCLATLVITAYYVYHSERIVVEAWEYMAPRTAVTMGVVLWALLLEGVRRAGGRTLAIMVGLISLYPMAAPYMPAFLSGQGYSFTGTASFHAMSTQAILGIPLQIMGQVVVGFIVLGVALEVTGAGKFFMDIALCLVGRSRGGPAKIAVLSSALFGSLSGSVVSNVLTTGSITIPMMKRSGYPPRVAAAMEACASTGGVLMPPVMGATAFIMASILQVPYLTIMTIALVPSLLFYLGLLVQADLYAAREGLRGLPPSEIPFLLTIFKAGWYYLLVFVILLYFIIVVRMEHLAPYYATIGLLVFAMLRRTDRFGPRRLILLLERSGRLLVQLTTIVAAVGLIIGALTMTGMAQSLALELVVLAGGSLFPLLLMGALASFILGIGIPITATYIFLAVTLTPALVRIGIDPLSAHLFVLYWGNISFITPPVALGVYAAATLAETDPGTAGVEAMKLGSVLYFIPFFFVLNPALILRGDSATEVLFALFTAIVGIVVLVSGLQNYIYGVGAIGGNPIVNLLVRGLLITGGALFALPEGPTAIVGFPLSLNLMGGIIAALTILVCWLRLRPGPLNQNRYESGSRVKSGT